jgi:hypothetical protein
LSSTDRPYDHPDPAVCKQSSMSIEHAIEVADIRADNLGLVVRPAEGYKGMD